MSVPLEKKESGKLKLKSKSYTPSAGSKLKKSNHEFHPSEHAQTVNAETLNSQQVDNYGHVQNYNQADMYQGYDQYPQNMGYGHTEDYQQNAYYNQNSNAISTYDYNQAQYNNVQPDSNNYADQQDESYGQNSQNPELNNNSHTSVGKKKPQGNYIYL